MGADSLFKCRFFNCCKFMINNPGLLGRRERDKSRMAKFRATAKGHGIQGRLLWLTKDQGTMLTAFFLSRGWVTSSPNKATDALLSAASREGNKEESKGDHTSNKQGELPL